MNIDEEDLYYTTESKYINEMARLILGIIFGKP